jgi:predicted nucleic acid-binding protein
MVAMNKNIPEALRRSVWRDPNDDMFLEAALAARAQMVIARDADLTDLEERGGESLRLAGGSITFARPAVRHIAG